MALLARRKYQVVWFDPDTGDVVKKDTLQGYSADSCWSRGCTRSGHMRLDSYEGKRDDTRTHSGHPTAAFISKLSMIDVAFLFLVGLR